MRMTSYERVRNTLNHEPIDQVACHDSLWSETRERWGKEGIDTSDGCNQAWAYGRQKDNHSRRNDACLWESSLFICPRSRKIIIIA